MTLLPRLLPVLLAFVAMATVAVAPISTATTLPTGFIEEDIEGQWAGALGIQFDPTGRAFVWERDGYVWIVENGVKSAQPFLDLREEVGGWRDFGLLGFTLHPNFAQNGFFYVFYVVDRHHLLNFGTPAYDPNTDEYFNATQGRIARFKAKLKSGSSDYSDAFETDYGSRFVLLGDAIGTGPPILYESHGTGALIFGTDGTLLAASGDGASYSAEDYGSVGHTYFAQALADNIITPEENVGALRSQLLTSLAGKLIRIDPDTGDGVPSNPWYDGAAPRSAKSRTWALGLRNPYRMVVRPGTGSHDAADGDPGAIFIGDVGWGTWEDIHVSKSPGQNFGWPIYEGIDAHAGYSAASTPNLAAPNPLFGIGGCTQEFFTFQDLLINETLDPNPSWPNPCDAAQEIPAEFVQMHSRPEIDYRHGSGPSRWSAFDSGGNPVSYNLGTTPGDPSVTPVPGPQFGGNTSTAGFFYEGSDFPASYQGMYFHGDYGSTWIRGFRFDANHEPTEVVDFAAGAGGVVFLSTSPVDGHLYYASYSAAFEAYFRKVSWIDDGNLPPNAVASIVGNNYGPEPLQIAFQGDQSSDPDGLPLSYDWNFGDGNNSTAANPMHTFDPPTADPTSYTVTLTVTDDGQANPDKTDQTTLFVSVNNSPPSVNVTSPVDGALYSMLQSEVYDLTADISDVEHSGGELSCGWVTTLHHDDHVHAGQIDPNCTSTTVISPVGCDGHVYFWEVALTVTDAAGLASSESVYLYPDCPNVAPVANDDSANVYQGYSVDVDILANDFDLVGVIDPSTVAVTTPPANGTIDAVDPVTGIVSYTHDGLGSSSDSFGYTVDDDEGLTSNAATVIIAATNDDPAVAILSPADQSGFQSGQVIALSANATDLEDGIPASVDWEIQRIHNAALIPGVYEVSGASPGGYLIPDVGVPGDHISYLVNVTAIDSVGATAFDQVHILPNVPPANNAPVADFTAGATIGSPPIAILFDAASTFDLDGDYLIYEWDFGDGGTDTGQTASHTFTSEGTFDVTLTVIDAVGATDTANLQVQILIPGLEAEYFSNMTLLDPPALLRTDPIIDFQWGNGSPDASIPANAFSARWTGDVEAQFSESYTFYTNTDDGVRLWVDGVLIVDQWVNQAPTEHTSTPVVMAAGQKLPLVMEYFENGGGAVAQLSWSSASQSKQVIPAGRLTGAVPPNQPPIAVNDAATLFDGYSVAVDVLANDIDDTGALDPASVIVTGAPSAGSTAVDLVTGEISYFHNASGAGSDSLAYTVEDTDGEVSNAGTVFLTIYPTPTVTLDSPVDSAVIAGDQIDLTYTISADPATYNHIHFKLDDDPHISDFTPDGSFSFLNVPAGPHTITTWLVTSDHQPLPNPESQDAVNVTLVAGVGCGNGLTEAGEDCDDGNTADGDCCSATCSFEIVGSACSDADACTDVDQCDGSGTCVAGAPVACDDGLYCNGNESCDSATGCVAGTAPVIDDGVSCTADSCDEAGDVVLHVPDDLVCDNGLYCDGSETCDTVLDCQAGTPPAADDGVACTLDSCDESSDTILNDPDDANCDDGDACTADSCDAVSGCSNTPIPGCDTGFTAYNDCVYDPGLTGNPDPNGSSVHYIGANVTTFGVGTVAPDASLPAGAYPNTAGELLDQSDGSGTGVTATFAESGGVTWQPQVSALPPSAANGWHGGYDSALGTDARNTFGGLTDMTGVTYYGTAGWWIELTLTGLDPANRYTFATSASRAKANSEGAPGYDDRDSLYTLIGADSASNGSTAGVTEISPTQVQMNTGNNHLNGYVARWTDIAPGADGSIVIRAEAAASAPEGRKAYGFDVFMLQEVVPAVCGDGVVGGAELCDDGNTADGDCCSATCGFEAAASACDDGDACTDVDTCDGAGACVAGSPLSCDDGMFCNGSESCDALLGCQPGTPPVVDDGVACTDDSCDEVADVVSNTPNDGSCGNGQFCDGTETCDALLDCQPGTPPVIDDAVGCTIDSCDEGSDTILHAPDHGSCSNGLYCDGDEVCDTALDCQAGAPVAVDDGVVCTDDSCDELADAVVNAPNDGNCDNGLYCDGGETCDAVLDCQPGTPVSIDDAVACTDDSCDEAIDTVVNTPNDGNCDNGLYCDGAETCDAVLDCQAGTPPSSNDGLFCTDDSCDEGTDSIVNVPDDAKCNDFDPCTADSCDAVTGCAFDPIVGCADTDGDGVADSEDNCPDVSNPNQADSNGNGVGDACETTLVPATPAAGLLLVALLLTMAAGLMLRARTERSSL